MSSECLTNSLHRQHYIKNVGWKKNPKGGRTKGKIDAVFALLSITRWLPAGKVLPSLFSDDAI